MWPPMWTRIAARGLCRSALALEVLERHAEVLAVAVDELDLGAGADRRQRRRHEGVGGAEHGLAADPGELERGQGAAGPAREAEARQPVPLGPALLEGVQLRPLRPLLGVEHLGPELEQPGAVTVVEPDRELASRRAGLSLRTLRWLLGCDG